MIIPRNRSEPLPEVEPTPEPREPAMASNTVVAPETLVVNQAEDDEDQMEFDFDDNDV